MAVRQGRVVVAVGRLMNDCLLSIVVPVLNEAAIIRPALHALQGLREAGVELIVVDDCSTDNTVEILIKNKIHFFKEIIYRFLIYYLFFLSFFLFLDLRLRIL